MSTPWQRQPLAPLSGGADATVQLSEGLVNRVIARQASPLVAVSGIASGAGTDPVSTSDDPPQIGTVNLVDRNTQLVFSARNHAYAALVPPDGGGGVLRFSPFGDDATQIATTEFSVSFGPLTIDLAASVAAPAGRVVLNADANISYSTQSVWVKVIDPRGGAGPPLLGTPEGDLYQQLGLPVGPVAVPVGPSSSSPSTTVDGTIRIVAGLQVVANAQSRAIDLTADLASASVDLISSDVGAQALDDEIKARVLASLGNLAAPGGGLLLAPRISLVGTLAAGAQVNELTITGIDVGVLPATGGHPACLWLAVRLAGGSMAAVTPEPFLTADYAYLCNERVIRAVYAYRWRTGDCPTGYIGQPASDQVKENGVTKSILITTRLVQTDAVDDQGNVAAFIKPMQPPPKRQEDFVELGGHAYGAIYSITYADGSPVSQKIRDSYADSDPFTFANGYFFSNIGPPTANPVPALDAYFAAVRTGVTSHFSRPFAGSPGVALQLRAVNGIDNLFLTQANVTQL
jgi:hypothetical protein